MAALALWRNENAKGRGCGCRFNRFWCSYSLPWAYLSLPKKMKKKNPPINIKVPDRLYFKIGEVSKITSLPAYVLRFWETEFSCIRPKRTSSGQRQYRKSDVETILKIRQLLHEKKYTIRGAKQYLRGEKAEKSESANGVLKEVRSELQSIRDLLNE